MPTAIFKTDIQHHERPSGFAQGEHPTAAERLLVVFIGEHDIKTGVPTFSQ